ncbi:hypothetical protein [Cellvibrio sp. OA-2007]|uniref:hypothetical protein n=1 Tax=Cellvibrio sp. OA-2007 TaxID=529823 RepID=UPI000784D610|nr:hypothetical protein [Cellvibrio sp. OA-2007]
MAERKEEEVTFASFKGLGYVSMVKGVPLFPLLILCFLGIAGTFLLVFLVGVAGLLWLFLCAGALLGLKTVCESDNKAMERARWNIKALLLRFKKSSTVLTVSPNKIGSKHERFRKKLTKIHRSS